MRIMEYLFKKGRNCRKIVNYYYKKKENGIWRSNTLRDMHKKYRKVDAGFGSYGWETEDFKGPASVGKYCSIGPGIKRFEKNHLYSSVTTHPFLFNPSYGWIEKDPRSDVHLYIGNDVWIGANVIILPSVKTIGNGSIIAAGAVLTTDIPAYEIWGGVPAKKIKDRFPQDIKQRMEEIEWWNLDDKTLKDNLELLYYPDQFIKAFDERKAQL